METLSQAVLLRIFIDSSDRWHHKSLHLALVEAAQKHGLAGATVLRGTEGFGAHSRIHTNRFVELTTDLPIVVEIVDAEEKIQAFLPTVEEMVMEGLATWERVNVILYRARPTG